MLPRQGPIFGSIAEQLEAGFLTHRHLHETQLAVAYFQDQTATDGPIELLDTLYTQAMDHPRVVALSVGTRPDWIDDAVFELLGKLSKKKPVFLELGLQCANDAILKSINRGHGVLDFENAVKKAHQYGLEIVAHVILGLPGENVADRIATADCLNRLGVEGVKLHNLHVLIDTLLADRFLAGEVHIPTLDEYSDMVVHFLQLLHPEMVIHRLVGHGPKHLMLSPEWALHKNKAIEKIEQILVSKNLWQGKLFCTQWRRN